MTARNTFFADKAGNEYDDPMLALCWEHAMNPQPGVDEAQREHGRYDVQALIDAKILAPKESGAERHFLQRRRAAAARGWWALERKPQVP